MLYIHRCPNTRRKSQSNARDGDGHGGARRNKAEAGRRRRDTTRTPRAKIEKNARGSRAARRRGADGTSAAPGAPQGPIFFRDTCMGVNYFYFRDVIEDRLLRYLPRSTGPSWVCFSFRAYTARRGGPVGCRAFRSGRLPPACASIDWHTFAMLFQWQLHPERSPTHSRWRHADRHAACNAAETRHATHRSRCLAKSGPSLQSSQRHRSE